jgi:hypothetical protein
MVRGLDLFKEHFIGFGDHYVLIGGTACSIAMERAGIDFRLTKDLDIVLCVEALNAEFGAAFWEFIKKGKYQNQQRSSGKKVFYRFDKPEDGRFPFMIELFSRVPDALVLADDTHLTPIPVDEEISSLSAILMDEDYYGFIQRGKQETDGLSVVTEEYLIPLKARAWLDMFERQKQGETIDTKDIRKHRADIFRLYRLLSPETRVVLPDPIKRDMQEFLNRSKGDKTINLKDLGLKNTSLEAVLADLGKVYELDY